MLRNGSEGNLILGFDDALVLQIETYTFVWDTQMISLATQTPPLVDKGILPEPCTNST